MRGKCKLAIRRRSCFAPKLTISSTIVSFNDRITASRTMPARASQYRPLPSQLHPVLAESLCECSLALSFPNESPRQDQLRGLI